MTLLGAPLTESEGERFPGIDWDVLTDAGLRRVDSAEGGQIVGRNHGGDYSGIIFPYYWPGEKHAREYRLRRDNPEMERKADGSLKEKNKYLSAPGARLRTYLHPWTEKEWLLDTRIPIVVTEGEKKTMALLGLASIDRCLVDESPRFLPIGLAGVWGFRGRIGKVENAKGERVDEVGVVPDIENINWQGREVRILFDSNVHTNESVRAARDVLAAELRKRGALVKYVDIPQDAGVNGVDDLVGVWGKERVLRLIETGAYDPKVTKSETKEPTIRRVQDVPSLSGLPEEKIEYLVDRLIPRGAVVLLTGEAGHGKSTLMSAIAGAISSSESFAGLTTAATSVLYLDRENPKAVAQERLKRLGIATSSTFTYWGGWLAEEAPALASSIVMSWVAETDPKPLIVIDSLIAFLEDGDENDSKAMRALVNQARALANLGAAVVILHHPGKSETARDYRGSSDLKPAVDCAFRLTDLSEGRLEHLRLKAFKARIPVAPDLMIHWRDGAFVADEKPESLGRTVTQRLGDLLRENPGITARKFQELAVTAGLGERRAFDFLKDGAEHGWVRREKGPRNSMNHYLTEDFDL